MTFLLFRETEKKVDKKEMTPWEIAAAERDAKRRRASYRNKVHTNRKTYTEVFLHGLSLIFVLFVYAVEKELEWNSYKQYIIICWLFKK